MSKPNIKVKKCINCYSSFKPWRKTQKFCQRDCYYEYGNRSKRKKSTWWINKKGYVDGRVWVDSETQITVKRHRWVMENHLGRPLKDNEDVHHLNGNKTDNSIGNLRVLSHSEHSTLTNLNRNYKSGYNMDLSASERKRRSKVLRNWHKEQALKKAGVEL